MFLIDALKPKVEKKLKTLFIFCATLLQAATKKFKFYYTRQKKNGYSSSLI